MFSNVQAARDALRERADSLITEYLDIAKQAKAAGDYESAYKALQWLIEHAPGDADGSRVVDVSVDKKPQREEQQVGPRIQIGIQLGGVKAKELPEASAKVLPGEVIDAKSKDTA